MKVLELIENPNNRVIETKKSIIVESTPAFDKRTFPVGELFPLDSNMTKWGVGLGSADEIIEFSADGDKSARTIAQDFLDDVGESNRTNAARLKARARSSGGVIKNFAGLMGSLNKRGTYATFAALEAIKNSSRVGPTLSRVLTSPVWRGFGKIVGAVGVPALIVWTNIGIINELEIEAEADPNKQEENYALRNILISQTSAQLLVYLTMIVRNGSLFRKALSGIKWTVRAIQGATAATGVGAIPSVLSLLVTESAWLIAGFIISSERVQRALAEWIHGSMVSVLFEGAGQLISGAATVLDVALDGAFGSGALRRSMGWGGETAEEAADGEVVGTSDWAKLVFHGLLFPPGTEKMLVPYINPEERTRLLQAALGLEVQQDTTSDSQTAADAAIDRRMDGDAAATQTSEPGMANQEIPAPTASGYENMSPEDYQAMAANMAPGG